MCDILTNQNKKENKKGKSKKSKNNIILDLSQNIIKNEEIDWDKYSRDIFDSIQIEDDLSEEKQGINPFLEEFTCTFEQLNDNNNDNNDKDLNNDEYNNSDKSLNNNNSTLEERFIESWDYFKLKDLQKVAEYYEIPYKGKIKSKLIEKIVEFEEKEENGMKVYDREVYWNMMNTLSKNKFFSKYIINWNN